MSFLGKPLPFGTLGKHKKTEFQDANVCLFVFDCLYYNGKSLIREPLSYRKKILKENMQEIPNRIMFSELEEIHKPRDLANMIAKVLQLGLEGLVLKDLQSIYEPGKRHWLKVKKDYLFGGAMADTADLLVLGAWYGTGKKGGMMSVFLMGCYNPNSKRFGTVTKVHTGHDDSTLEKLQKELVMEKISQDASKVPRWLNCTKTMIPDFVAKDPKQQPVWEITGAEFTQQHEVHTANGISIRFPRVTRIRDDKTWETATNLQELQHLFKTSKENTDVSLLTKNLVKDDDVGESPKKKKQKKEKTKCIDSEDDEDKKPEGSSNVKESNSSDEDKADIDDEVINHPSTSKKLKLNNTRLKRALDSDEDKTDIEDDNDLQEEPPAKTRKGNKSPLSGKKIVSKNRIKDVSIANPLPNYFEGVKALIEDELKKEEHSELLR